MGFGHEVVSVNKDNGIFMKSKTICPKVFDFF